MDKWLFQVIYGHSLPINLTIGVIQETKIADHNQIKLPTAMSFLYRPAGSRGNECRSLLLCVANLAVPFKARTDFGTDSGPPLIQPGRDRGQSIFVDWPGSGGKWRWRRHVYSHLINSVRLISDRLSVSIHSLRCSIGEQDISTGMSWL